MVQLPAFKIKIYVEIVCETPGAAFVLSTVLDLSHSFPKLLLTMQVVMILSNSPVCLGEVRATHMSSFRQNGLGHGEDDFKMTKEGELA